MGTPPAAINPRRTIQASAKTAGAIPTAVAPAEARAAKAPGAIAAGTAAPRRDAGREQWDEARVACTKYLQGNGPAPAAELLQAG